MEGGCWIHVGRGSVTEVLWFYTSKNMTIDATENNRHLGRLVNDGMGWMNLLIVWWECYLVHMPHPPCICLFALKDIEPGEELRYDYGNPMLPWRRVSIKWTSGMVGIESLVLKRLNKAASTKPLQPWISAIHTQFCMLPGSAKALCPGWCGLVSYIIL